MNIWTPKYIVEQQVYRVFHIDSPKVFLVLLEYGYIVQPTGGSTVMVDLKKYVCKFLVCHL